MKLSSIFTKVRGTLPAQLPRAANALTWGIGIAVVGAAAPYMDRFIPDSPTLSFALAAIGGVIGLCEGYTRTAEQQRLKRIEQQDAQTPRRPRRQPMRMSEPLYEG